MAQGMISERMSLGRCTLVVNRDSAVLETDSVVMDYKLADGSRARSWDKTEFSA